MGSVSIWTTTLDFSKTAGTMAFAGLAKSCVEAEKKGAKDPLRPTNDNIFSFVFLLCLTKKTL